MFVYYYNCLEYVMTQNRQTQDDQPPPSAESVSGLYSSYAA